MIRGALRATRTDSCSIIRYTQPFNRQFTLLHSLRQKDNKGRIEEEEEEFNLLSSDTAKKDEDTSAQNDLSFPGTQSSSSSPHTPSSTMPGSSIGKGSSRNSDFASQLIDFTKSDKFNKTFPSPEPKDATKEIHSDWADIMKTLTSSGYSSINSQAQDDTSKPVDEFEEVWKLRQLHGPSRCAIPRDGRTSIVKSGQSDPSRNYGALASLISRNNVKYELRLGERYEKPNQMRRRLRSERHRRRFAEAVREKVRLVMELKSRGA